MSESQSCSDLTLKEFLINHHDFSVVVYYASHDPGAQISNFSALLYGVRIYKLSVKNITSFSLKRINEKRVDPSVICCFRDFRPTFDILVEILPGHLQKFLSKSPAFAIYQFVDFFLKLPLQIECLLNEDWVCFWNKVFRFLLELFNAFTERRRVKEDEVFDVFWNLFVVLYQ